MIRKMTIEDIRAVMDIEEVCFTSRWNEEMFLYEIEENEFGSFFVCEDEGTIVGFIDFWVTFETCQLANLAVHPTYQKKGYAKEMMEQMITLASKAGCETIMLEVRVSNQKARYLYESFDFFEMNIRKGYYSDNGEDAIVMCKALGGGLE
ncbi:ribosomal protein S18-alanine N-acetyltransferase [Amedibacillus sp. YH-ame6]